MTDRYRLIELVDKAKEEYAGDVTDHTETDYIVETLLNEGAILPLCKVGDKVYMIFENEIRKLRVISLSYLFSSSFNHFNLHTENSRGAVLSYEMKDIGKSVFLTKSQAEQKLKELKSDD